MSKGRAQCERRDRTGGARGPPTMHEALGTTGWTPIPWGSDDAVVYAAAVGAGSQHGSRLPRPVARPVGVPDPSSVPASSVRDRQNEPREPWAFDSHATFTLGCDMSFHRRVPSTNNDEGVVETRATAVWDKGSSAVVVTDTGVSIGGQLICSVTTSMLIQGRGKASAASEVQAGHPHQSSTTPVEVDIHLPPNSAALYQLVGDHNPHSLDPAFAAEMGLPGPISAGQLLIGATARHPHGHVRQRRSPGPVGASSCRVHRTSRHRPSPDDADPSQHSRCLRLRGPLRRPACPSRRARTTCALDPIL